MTKLETKKWIIKGDINAKQTDQWSPMVTLIRTTPEASIKGGLSLYP